jgi:hypothetical protein
MDRVEFDECLRMERPLINLFGETAPKISYDAIEPGKICPNADVCKTLHARGAYCTITSAGVIRASCHCGNAVSIIETASLGVSQKELLRISNHVMSCTCATRKKHRNARN